MDWSKCVQTVTTTDPKTGVVTTLAKDVATLDCIPTIFSNVLNFAFGFAGVAALFFVFFAGFKFLTSGGDEKKLEGAKHTLTYAIIGLVVILLSFAIINFISQVTGAGCILSFGFDLCK